MAKWCGSLTRARQGGGGERTDARRGDQAFGVGMFTGDLSDLAIVSSDELIQALQGFAALIDQGTHQPGEAVVSILKNRGQCLSQLREPLGCDQTVFRQQATQLVRQRGSLGDRSAADAMQALDVLLPRLLDGHTAHVRAQQRLADRFGIGSVVLVALDEGFDILCGDEPDRVPQCGELARPVVRSPASFQPDQAGSKLSKELQKLRPRQPLSEHRAIGSIHAVELKG